MSQVLGAGFHHVTARSRLARVLKLMNPLSLLFSIYFSGHGKPRVTETVDTGARLYFDIKKNLIRFGSLSSEASSK
jgi:hypothetical protein